MGAGGMPGLNLVEAPNSSDFNVAPASVTKFTS